MDDYFAKVVEIGEARVKRKRATIDGCKHLNQTYCTRECAIWCDDCGQQIDHFKAFLMLMEGFERQQDRLKSERRQLEEDKRKVVTLRAAQKVQEAWRRKKMVPTCPHCHTAIFPEDGFGSSAISKEWAVAARKKRAEKKAADASKQNDRKENKNQ